jgi:hypothetical protein
MIKNKSISSPTIKWREAWQVTKKKVKYSVKNSKKYYIHQGIRNMQEK